MVQLSHPYMTIGKTITLTGQAFVSKVTCLLFNTLSRFVIAFLPRNKCLLISWLQSLSSVIFGAQENKTCHCFHFFPFYLPWSNGTGFHDLSFFQCWDLSQLFHSHWPSSRGSSVPLCFLPLERFLCLVAQSFPTLCNPKAVACQAPLSLWILQARILQWVVMPSSRGSSKPRSRALQADSLPSETPWKPLSQWRSYEKQNYIEWNTEGEDGR